MIKKFLVFLVYCILFISTWGIVFLDDPLKELGYLLVFVLMMNILYKRYYLYKMKYSHTLKDGVS